MPTIKQLTAWKKNEIRQFFQKPYRMYRVNGLDIRIAPTTGQFGRILLITSSKSGNAPERNKFRRRAKNIFLKHSLYEVGYDWIVIAKREGLLLAYPKLEAIFADIAQSL